MKSLNKLFLIVAAVLALNACSASVTSDNPVPTPNIPLKEDFFDSRPAVEGPAVEGSWASLCTQRIASQTYRRFLMVFAASTVTRTEVNYKDADCTQKTDETILKGRFRFIEKYSDGGYNIEYAFDVGSGMTSFPQEKLIVESNQVFISNYAVGDATPVLKDEPLWKEGTAPLIPPVTPPVPPAPVPIKKPALKAYSYADVKYAFCSVQGFGVMINFQRTGINSNLTGEALTGSKVCGANKPVSWGTKTIPYSITMKNGYPQITLGSSYISTSNYEPGLGAKSSGYSVLFGNSGDCFFNQDDGTMGLNFTYACD